MIDVNSFFSNNFSDKQQPSCQEKATIIETAQACSIANNLSCIVVDFDSRRPIFMSDNLIYLDEAIPSDFKRVCDNPYWALVKEETLEELAKIHEDYFKLKNLMTEHEYSGHLCVMDYPIYIKGKDFYINSRFTPVKTSEDGSIRMGIFFFQPSSKKELSFLVVTSTGKRWAYDSNKRSFKAFDIGIKLTITEKAILQRAKKGMSNEEIANSLFLSINTVKSHKMHIFKKLEVENITEALIVLGNYQLL